MEAKPPAMNIARTSFVPFSDSHVPFSNSSISPSQSLQQVVGVTPDSFGASGTAWIAVATSSCNSGEVALFYQANHLAPPPRSPPSPTEGLLSFAGPPSVELQFPFGLIRPPAPHQGPSTPQFHHHGCLPSSSSSSHLLDLPLAGHPNEKRRRPTKEGGLALLPDPSPATAVPRRRRESVRRAPNPWAPLFCSARPRDAAFDLLVPPSPATAGPPSTSSPFSLVPWRSSSPPPSPTPTTSPEFHLQTPTVEHPPPPPRTSSVGLLRSPQAKPPPPSVSSRSPPAPQSLGSPPPPRQRLERPQPPCLSPPP